MVFILGPPPFNCKKACSYGKKKKAFTRFFSPVVLCHRLVYGLPSTEYIALEDGEGKNKKERRRERRGDEGEERRGEDRKREEDNAANSRCLLACFASSFFSRSPSPLPFVAISSRRKINPALALGSPFVPSRSPRSGEHESPYSDSTSENQLKQMTSSRARRRRRQFDRGCLVKLAPSDRPY